MKKSKLSVILVICLACIFALAGCGGGGDKQPAKQGDAKPSQGVKNYVIPGGSMGGTFYTAGTIFSDVINKNVPGVSFSARSGGTIENILLLEKKEADFVISSGFDYYMAKKSLPKDSEKLRSILLLPWNANLLIVPKDSTVTNLYDLKGKSVNFSDRRVGNYAFNQHILDVAGLKESDFSPQYLASSEGATALSEGKIVGSFFLTAVPAPSLVAIANSPKGGKVIPYGKEFLDKLLTKYPFYFLVDITPESAVGLGLTGPVTVPAYWPELLTTTDVSEELVYNITKTLMTNHSELVARWDALKMTTPENAVKNTAFKLHPGAEKYYREIGLIK